MLATAGRRLLPLLIATALLAFALVLARVQPSGATDPEAPKGAPPHWLPNEQWVWQHWLPYDEGRLYSLLDITRRDLWHQLRDDTRTVGQLGERHGWKPRALATALVAPRRSSVSSAKFRELRSRALRTLTQGHLAQHIFFHSLHQSVIPNRAPLIFGVKSTEEFQRLRRAELSPLQICRLYGHSRSQTEGAAAAALRDRVRAGVQRGDVSATQGRILLSRQLRQLPRWLQQVRYNGPPPLRRNPKAVTQARDYANDAQITADGRRVVFEAYESSIPLAKKNGEINVRMRALGAERSRLVSKVEPADRKAPRSAYNSSVSADGRYVAYETSAGNLNFAKRYGGIAVIVRDLVARKTIHVDPVSRADARREPRSSYNPQISADGRWVAFESSRQVRRGGRLSYALGVFVHDLRSGRTTALALTGPAGHRDASEPQISADGRFVAFTSTARGGAGGRSRVLVQDVVSGRTVVASRADGRAGALAEGESYEPKISADGRLVAFTSTARNLGAAGKRQSRVYVRDLRSGRTELVSVAGGPDGPHAGAFAFEPAISSDGRFVAFASVVPGGKGRTGRRSQIFLRDLAGGTTALVSRESGTGGTRAHGFSSDPSVSNGGRFVVFTSDAPNLSDRKIHRVRGIFVRDTAKGETALVSEGFPVERSHRRRIAAAIAAVLVLFAGIALLIRRAARRRRLAVAGARS
jgi:Tol biopolymer transport system component